MQDVSTQRFTDIVEISARLLRPGISVEESQKLYDQWASTGTYDQLSDKAQYFTSHDKIMAAVLDLCANRRDVNILDVGAGTGLIGKRLHTEGFTNLDAMDPSQEMLKAARKTGVYKNYIHGFFTEEPNPEIENDTYDLILLCGVCGPAAVPVEAFKEACRIVKPGGFIVNCMRAEYLETLPEYQGRWEPYMDFLINNRKLEVVSEQRYPNHYFHYDGLRLIHRVL